MARMCMKEYTRFETESPPVGATNARKKTPAKFSRDRYESQNFARQNFARSGSVSSLSRPRPTRDPRTSVETPNHIHVARPFFVLTIPCMCRHLERVGEEAGLQHHERRRHVLSAEDSPVVASFVRRRVEQLGGGVRKLRRGTTGWGKGGGCYRTYFNNKDKCMC